MSHCHYPYDVIIIFVYDNDKWKIYRYSFFWLFQDVVAPMSKDAPIEWMEAEDPLFMLYTSGSTGKPKV